MNLDIEKVLKSLREKYPNNLEQIDKDEKKLRTLLAQQEFAKHPVAIAMAEDATQRINQINFLLAYDPDLNLPENAERRTALFERRKAFKFTIERLGVDKDQIQSRIQAEHDELQYWLER